jgi:protein TonB
MFETATLSYGSSGKRVWTTAMGLTGQALLVACALLAPMISPQALPRVAWLVSIAPPGPPPPPPLPPGQQSATHSPAPVSQFRNGILLIPKTIPKGPMILEDPELPAFSDGPGVPGGVPLGREGGAPGGILSDLLSSAARTLPVLRPPDTVHHDVPKPAATVAPPRITTVKMASPIRRVDPVYPALARQARVSGTVELLGVLGVDGRIHELKVVRGHPLLVKAAIEAVRQWVYEPTLLNGQAVEVSAPILVNFILN